VTRGTTEAIPIIRPNVTSSVKLTKPVHSALRRSSISIITPKTVLSAKGRDSCPNLSKTSDSVQIRIEIISNWGHDSKVSCSALDFLGYDKSTIKIQSMSIEPPSIDRASMACLTNGVLIKPDNMQKWEQNWPPEPPFTSITLVFHINPSPQLEFVRVWPCTDVTKNIKQVRIQMNRKTIFKGDFPSEFGSIVALRDENGFLKASDSGTRVVIAYPNNDTFGVLPSIRTFAVDIYILETYGTNQVFGLHMIRVFDTNAFPIFANNSTVYEAVECGDHEYPESLFKDMKPKLLENPNTKFEGWCGEIKSKKTAISIRYSQPQQIAAIMLVNMLAVNPSAECGVKKVMIRLNGHLVWTGRVLKRQDSDTGGYENSTIAFITDNIPLKRHIQETAIPNFTSVFIKKEIDFSAMDIDEE